RRSSDAKAGHPRRSGFLHVPRNLTPNFRLYIRQRPEMKSSTTRNQRRPRQQKEKTQIMKNQPTKSKSTIINIVAACLVLAVLGPPAAELTTASNGRGGPPIFYQGTIILPGICGFDVQVSGSFRQGVIS